MKFRFKDYKGDYVMWCKTEEEAKDFCRVMHESGRKWESGKSYKINNWILEKENMCYMFNYNTFLSKEDAIDDGYTILKWEDFMEKEFTLNDLKVGMLIENKEGEKFIIAETIDGRLIGTNETGFTDLKNYDTDMTCWEFASYDIMRVYNKTKRNIKFYTYDTTNRDLLFQRKEPKELTMQEIADKFNIPVDQLKIKK